MSEAVVELSASPRAALERNWIVSPAFDLALLIFAPLATLPVILVYAKGVPLYGNLFAMILGFTHYASTTAFYFWDENVPYHRSRWLAFYAGPVILAAIYFVFIFARVPYIIQFVIFFWNTFHVARQNCGIVSIYRNRSDVRDASQKTAANRAIIAVSGFLALWNIETHEEVIAIFGRISPHFATYVKVAAGALAAVAVFGLIQATLRRYRNREPMTLPETLLIATSLAFFYPYLFIRSSLIATGAMLIPHYLQYMALVWLLHRRKFGSAAAGAPEFLRRMSASTKALLPLLLFIGMIWYVLYRISTHYARLDVFETAFLLIALEHFYLDGLIWSFRQPHVRRTIGPFFMRPARSFA